MVRWSAWSTAIAILGLGCAAPAPSPAPRPPAPVETRPEVPTDPVVARVLLTTLPDTLLYDFTQTARFEPAGGDTSSAVVTRALYSLSIAPQDDASLEAIVSVDSLEVTNEGGSRRPILGRPQWLGPVLRVTVSTNGRILEQLLPDSLCTYGHLVAAAQELFVPALGAQAVITNNQAWRDTTVSSVCRTGSRIAVTTARETRSTLGDTVTFRGNSSTLLDGRGILRRDSVLVRGTLAGETEALIPSGARFPVIVRTRSNGELTIHLADSSSRFRQTTEHQFVQRPGTR